MMEKTFNDFYSSATLAEEVMKYKLKVDEYIDEKSGEVYCAKCKTSRTICLPEYGHFMVGSMCKCRQEELRAEEELRCKQERMEKYKRLIQGSLLGKRFMEASFNNLDKKRPKDFLEVMERCKKFVANWDIVKQSGQGFYLYGDVGTGKTLLTACLGKELINNFVPVMFSSFVEISKSLRNTYKNSSLETESSLIDKIVEIDLLIIDDIGTERVKKDGEDTFLQEKIFDIVNRRYENRKPTIFTSNYSLKQLLEERGIEERTIDRINEMSAAVMELRGQSYRQVLSDKKAVF